MPDLKDREFLLNLADAFDRMPRRARGAGEDEGYTFVAMEDGMMRELAAEFRRIGNRGGNEN